MSKVVGSGLRTRERCTSDLSARMTAAPTGLTGSPPFSSWLPIAPITTARSTESIPRRMRMPFARTAPGCSWLLPAARVADVVQVGRERRQLRLALGIAQALQGIVGDAGGQVGVARSVLGVSD